MSFSWWIAVDAGMGEGADDVGTYFYGCCGLAGGFEI